MNTTRLNNEASGKDVVHEKTGLGTGSAQQHAGASMPPSDASDRSQTQQAANNSPQVSQLMKLQGAANQSSQVAEARQLQPHVNQGVTGHVVQRIEGDEEMTDLEEESEVTMEKEESDTAPMDIETEEQEVEKTHQEKFREKRNDIRKSFLEQVRGSVRDAAKEGQVPNEKSTNDRFDVYELVVDLWEQVFTL